MSLLNNTSRKMTDEQIDQLRALIQCEVDFMLREARGDEFAYEHNDFNTLAWETFRDTFK